MTDLTDREWLDVLFYDFWLPPAISMAEYELQIERVAEIMGEM